jgi:sRNA-binding carbon storage regulator CsrA
MLIESGRAINRDKTMYTLRHNTNEAIILEVDGRKIAISVDEMNHGSVRLKIDADSSVNITHRLETEEFVD